jgi:hypothetical protein
MESIRTTSNIRSPELSKASRREKFFWRACRFRRSPFDSQTQEVIQGENDVQYLLLIYNNESASAHTPELMAEYGAFTKSIIDSGHYKGGNPLQPVATATSVRVRDGKNLVTDGPFAETREQLGGYYLIEAANLDDALAIGARIPAARTGTIEVRPIWAMPGRA